MLMAYLYKIFIPEEIKQDAIKLTYAKNFIAACVISIFTAPLYALFYYMLSYRQASYVIMFSEAIMLSSLIVFKHVSTDVANAIFVGGLMAMLIWLTYSLGGIFSTTVYWLTLPPLIAVFIGGIRAGFIWCVFSIIVVFIFFLLAQTHYAFPISPVTNPLLLQLSGIIGLIIVVIFLTYFYESGKKASLKELRYLAFHDASTDLLNRNAYMEILEKRISDAKKYRIYFSIFHIEIDNLKKIYEVFGYETGDLLLKDIVQRLQRYLPHVDTMARTDSEKIKLIYKRNYNDDMDDDKELGSIILTILKAPFYVKKHEITIIISIGVAFFCGNYNVLMIDHFAGLALTKAKSLGGNNVQYFSEDLAKEEKFQIAVEQNLPYAMHNGELHLNFQPQFSTKNKLKISGIEVLLRWNQPIIGDIPSDVFIPVAERIGIIPQLGEWVLREACQQYMQWYRQNKFDPNLTLAINISVQQLYDTNFIATVEKVIKDTGIPPQNLELELTETVVISDQVYIVSIMEKLNNIGVHLVIDDFGAGYTSFKYLIWLPVMGLKIDKSFLANVPKDTHSSILIASLINLAHKINLKVVAEGVENSDQVLFLTKIHCDHLQGFFLSRPLDVAAMEELLLHQP